MARRHDQALNTHFKARKAHRHTMSHQGLKSIFISVYISTLAVTLGWATWVLWENSTSTGHWGVVLASGAPMAFFIRLFALPTARTSASMAWLSVAGVAGVALAAWADGLGAPLLMAALTGLIMTPAYTHWYSRFEQRDGAALTPGQLMPSITLNTADGQEVSTPTLTQQPALWLFYRGNWCPLCMAQIGEVAAQYRQLQTRGVEVYLISPQPQDHTRALAERFQAPMQFLHDRDNRAASRLGILAPDGLPAGLQVLGYDNDVPMPTVFITAPGGRIVYSDLTDNYRVRPDPAEFIKALDEAGL